jgi:ATP-dependent Clp protease protease subunit
MNRLFRKIIAMVAPAAAPSLELPDDDLPTTATDAAKDQSTEKTRIKAIIGGDEAVGREELAKFLALETGMSVAEAKAALSASARKSETSESTDAASTPASARAARIRQADENFTKVFGRAEYTIAEPPEDPLSVVARMQTNYARARGEKPQS